VLVVIFLIIVILIIVCGVIFGSVVSFLVINKIIRRHMHILQRKQTASENVVADLDDSSQVSQATTYEPSSSIQETSTFINTGTYTSKGKYDALDV